MPDRGVTRLVSAAADQIGQALVQDRFAAESQAAEVARQATPSSRPFCSPCHTTFARRWRRSGRSRDA